MSNLTVVNSDRFLSNPQKMPFKFLLVVSRAQKRNATACSGNEPLETLFLWSLRKRKRRLRKQKLFSKKAKKKWIRKEREWRNWDISWYLKIEDYSTANLPLLSALEGAYNTVFCTRYCNFPFINKILGISMQAKTMWKRVSAFSPALRALEWTEYWTQLSGLARMLCTFHRLVAC